MANYKNYYSILKLLICLIVSLFGIYNVVYADSSTVIRIDSDYAEANIKKDGIVSIKFKSNFWINKLGDSSKDKLKLDLIDLHYEKCENVKLLLDGQPIEYDDEEHYFAIPSPAIEEKHKLEISYDKKIKFDPHFDYVVFDFSLFMPIGAGINYGKRGYESEMKIIFEKPFSKDDYVPMYNDYDEIQYKKTYRLKDNVITGMRTSSNLKETIPMIYLYITPKYFERADFATVAGDTVFYVKAFDEMKEAEKNNALEIEKTKESLLSIDRIKDTLDAKVYRNRTIHFAMNSDILTTSGDIFSLPLEIPFDLTYCNNFVLNITDESGDTDSHNKVIINNEKNRAEIWIPNGLENDKNYNINLEYDVTIPDNGQDYSNILIFSYLYFLEFYNVYPKEYEANMTITFEKPFSVSYIDEIYSGGEPSYDMNYTVNGNTITGFRNRENLMDAPASYKMRLNNDYFDKKDNEGLIVVSIIIVIAVIFLISMFNSKKTYKM